jgi:hypothetical protein
MYAAFFTQVLKHRHRGRLKPFDFYLDATDGTRNNRGLFDRLGVPVLSLSRSPRDRRTLPVPDPHMLMGVLSGSARYPTLPEMEGYGKGAGPRPGAAPASPSRPHPHPPSIAGRPAS